MGEAKYINVGHRSPVKIDQCKLNILKIKNRPEIKKNGCSTGFDTASIARKLVHTKIFLFTVLAFMFVSFCFRLAPWYSLYDQAPL